MKSNDNHNHKVTDMNSKTTRVLSIDMGQEVVDFLRKENLETYEGTFGPFVDARNVDYCWDRLPIYLEQDLPDNLHEYSVVIEDLGFERKTISYDLEQIDKQKAIADTDSSFKSLCLAKPINVFDPVPFCCFLLKSNFETKKGELIKIIFQAPKYEVQYSGIRMSNNIHSIGVFSNYQNIVDFTQKSLSGDRVKLVNEYRLSEILFSGLENQLSYSQTFFHPSIPKNGSYDTEPNPHFIPLLLNEQGDIISYVYFEKKTCTFVLPQIENKVVLLERLFTNCLYRNFSELFPLQTKNTWLTKKEYELPEIVQLCEEKEEARNALFQNGLVDFRSNFKSIGKPYDYFKNNKVACIELHDTILSVGDKVYFEDDRKRLNVVEIVNIQVDRQNKQVVKDGKVGIKFTMKIPKGAVLLYKYL